MIVEYIRYKIDPSRTDEFDNAYRRAGVLFDVSPHCQRWEAARCVDGANKPGLAEPGMSPSMEVQS
jgi:hypothetical protein